MNPHCPNACAKKDNPCRQMDGVVKLGDPEDTMHEAEIFTSCRPINYAIDKDDYQCICKEVTTVFVCKCLSIHIFPRFGFACHAEMPMATRLNGGHLRDVKMAHFKRLFHFIWIAVSASPRLALPHLTPPHRQPQWDAKADRVHQPATLPLEWVTVAELMLVAELMGDLSSKLGSTDSLETCSIGI
ncbi:unnamed protein product [Protopolystoma xenopodis]|uniref:Uncharacterized protein n=1 Tax=Protopolystoma xenopodis TaxID=117903 RepID=A0A3S5CFJ1_9PLAT|nr:unnamed protein product [Protopolystoma xenopodis]